MTVTVSESSSSSSSSSSSALVDEELATLPAWARTDVPEISQPQLRALSEMYSVTEAERALVAQAQAQAQAQAETDAPRQQFAPRTDEIRSTPGRAAALREEILRLFERKRQIREVYPEHRIYCSDGSDEREEMLVQAVQRQLRSNPSAVNPSDHCLNPAHMRTLERDCPLLCARGSPYRRVLARTILTRDGVLPALVLMQLELLTLVEEGEISAEEASGRLGKMIMDREKLLLRMEALAASGATINLEAARSVMTNTELSEAAASAAPAAAAAAATPGRRIGYAEYALRRRGVAEQVRRAKEDSDRLAAPDL